MTFQQRCFRAIRKSGGTASIPTVVALLSAERERVTAAVIRLANRGWLKRVGDGVYTIAREDGEPEDLRGLATNSQTNLTAEGRARGAVYLRRRKDVAPKIPKPSTALEAAWGFMPPFPALQESGDS